MKIDKTEKFLYRIYRMMSKLKQTNFVWVGLIFCGLFFRESYAAPGESPKTHEIHKIRSGNLESRDICEDQCPTCMEDFEAGCEVVKFPCHCIQGYHRECFDRMDRCGYCKSRKIEFDTHTLKPTIPSSFQLGTVCRSSDLVAYSLSLALPSALPATMPNTPLELRHELINSWPGYDEFEQQFSQIPEGFLPTEMSRVRIKTFAAMIHPVTRKIWQAILPDQFPEELKSSWFACIDFPMTHVRWKMDDNEAGEIELFLNALNARTASLGCSYDLPTNEQLLYMMRGDQTGRLGMKYFVGEGGHIVDDSTLGAFSWYAKNSEGDIHPVGRLLKNQFGLELFGNVALISKSPSKIAYVATDSCFRSRVSLEGYLGRGIGWNENVQNFNLSNERMVFNAMAHSQLGFTLVRNCSVPRLE